MRQMIPQMASAAATAWHKPLAVVPCLSWTTASQCFTQGVMSGSINWEMLKNQYFSNDVFREELFDMIQSPEGHFPIYHEVGQKFARDFPQSLSHVEKIMKEDHRQQEEAVPNSSQQLAQKSHFVQHKEQVDIGYSRTKELNSDRMYSSIASAGGGFQGLNLSLPKFNILQNFSFSKRKVSKSDSSQMNKESKNILLQYKNAKSKISKTDFTPVGIRPKSAAHMKPVTFEPYMEVKDTLTWEAVQFMRGVMDECTHLGNFSVPVDPSLIIIVAAKNDGYMPRDGIIPLTDIWPGSEMRTLESGHITGYLFNHQVFREAIKESFDRVITKYYS